ncbi:MAG: TRAP transporter small permease [Burkholderiaceae bacterium]
MTSVTFLEKIETGFHRVTSLLIALVAISIGLFALSIPLNLLLVKMHWGSISWLNEGIGYVLYAGVFLGAPWVLQQGAHVKVDLFSSALGPPALVVLERVVDLIGATVCFVLFVYGFRAMVSEYQDGTMPDKSLSIANWYMMAIFAFSFLLLTIEFLFRMRRASQIVAQKSQEIAPSAF